MAGHAPAHPPHARRPAALPSLLASSRPAHSYPARPLPSDARYLCPLRCRGAVLAHPERTLDRLPCLRAGLRTSVGRCSESQLDIQKQTAHPRWGALKVSPYLSWDGKPRGRAVRRFLRRIRPCAQLSPRQAGCTQIAARMAGRVREIVVHQGRITPACCGVMCKSVFRQRSADWQCFHCLCETL